MSFNLVGCDSYESLPAGSMYEAKNSILSKVIGSSAGPIGFTTCDGLLVSLGDDGYYYYAEPDFLRDALVEWPAVQRPRSIYLVKWRMCDDPMAREKIMKADQEVYQRNQDRFRITESLRAKRSEKAGILSQLKILNDEDMQLGRVLDKKEPNASWEPGLCSSEEELDELILGLRYRINNCSAAEARRLTQEIKRFEMTREKVKSNAALRAWILEMSPEYATQGQVGDEALEEVRKKQEAVREQIKHLHRMIEVVEGEMKALEDDLAEVIVKRDLAYARIREIRRQRDDSNGFYYRNRAMLKDVRIAATNGVINIEKLVLSEVENFFSLWNSDRRFRDDYKRRIQPSLDLRQLDRDGRRRGLENKPPVAEEGCLNLGAQKCRAEEERVVIIDKEASPAIMSENGNDLVSGKSISFETVPTSITSGRSKVGEDMQMKLKEMKREEEIAKAKAAMERKKKLAEKNAVKAAIKAQKETEKKLKEQEKKARKKSMTPTALLEEAVDDNKAKENCGTLAQVKQGIYSRRDKFWRRHQPKGSDPVLKAILKRRRSANHWFWAVTIALFLAVFTVLGYCLLQQL